MAAVLVVTKFSFLSYRGVALSVCEEDMDQQSFNYSRVAQSTDQVFGSGFRVLGFGLRISVRSHNHGGDKGVYERGGEDG